MGSWDAACGITNLPIRGGDRVFGIYHGSVDHVRHTFDLFSWIKKATFGHYDTYGRIEEVGEAEPSCLYRFDALVALDLFEEGDFSPGREISIEEAEKVVGMQMGLRRGIPKLTGQQTADREELLQHIEVALVTAKLCNYLISEYEE